MRNSNIQGGPKVGLQQSFFFLYRNCQYLRRTINTVLYTVNCIPTFGPPFIKSTLNKTESVHRSNDIRKLTTQIHKKLHITTPSVMQQVPALD
jgi:hypothetical protein